MCLENRYVRIGSEIQPSKGCDLPEVFYKYVLNECQRIRTPNRVGFGAYEPPIRTEISQRLERPKERRHDTLRVVDT